MQPWDSSLGASRKWVSCPRDQIISPTQIRMRMSYRQPFTKKQTPSLDRIVLQPAASDHVTISWWVNDRTQKSDQFLVFDFKREIKKERRKKCIYLPSFPALTKLLPILAITLFLRKELISIIIYLQSSEKNKGIWHKARFLAWKSGPHLSSRGDCTGILMWSRGTHFYFLLEEFWWINLNPYRDWRHS